ncbi:M48 family metallopeptidase [Mailhella massiliensis]|uniref:M48 family metallopeptidase n=1 Tax=Mailhella massiliensis TaxID=1903261 RepID=UPI0023F3C981|nr:SprT family zinc-dependent metalloprotease [Mailhella massiliensis]
MLNRVCRSRKSDSRRIREEKTLVLPGTDLSFLFQRDGCRTLRIAVKADGSVRVKAPSRLALKEVFSFLHARLDWVRAKQDFFAAHRGAPSEFCEGGIIFYLGRPFTIRLMPAGKHVPARLAGRQLHLPLPPGRENDVSAVEKAFRLWRLTAAKHMLGRRLARMEQRARLLLGDEAAPASLTVRSLKRRWGSCTVRGDITLAAQLIALPLPLVDYVICHELCHLRQINHGPAFHRLLLRLLPDAREREGRIHVWALEHPR